MKDPLDGDLELLLSLLNVVPEILFSLLQQVLETQDYDPIHHY